MPFALSWFVYSTRRFLRPLAWLTLLSALGCGASFEQGALGQSTSLCTEATTRAEECFGVTPPWGHGEACDEAQAATLLEADCELGTIQPTNFTTGARSWLCQQLGWFCPATALAATTTPGVQLSIAPRYPILYVHGLRSSRMLIGTRNHPVYQHLRQRFGAHVDVANIAPFTPIRVNIFNLQHEVDRVLAETGAERLNIIAHSMGGLVTRALIAAGYAHKIASLTAVGSPHRGSPVADAAFEIVQLVPARAADLIAAIAGRTYTEADLADQANVYETLSNLSVQGVPFIPDSPLTVYFSLAGVSTFSPFRWDFSQEERTDCGGRIFMESPVHYTRATYWALAAFLPGPSDGVVPVKSAMHGNALGCVAADHTAIFPNTTDGTVNPDTGIDLTTLHARLVENLIVNGL